MNEKVKVFLESKQKEIEIEREQRKSKKLISLGLYDKVYSPDNNCTEEYRFSEWDAKDQQYKYYKKVPIEVSDEEFEEIQVVSKSSNEQQTNPKNPVSVLLTVIAWIIYICGFIFGIVEGNTAAKPSDSDFSLATALVYWFVSLISGTPMLFLAEFLKILNDIKNKR